MRARPIFTCDGQCDAITATLDSLLGGTAGHVVISGLAGVGKTAVLDRVLAELAVGSARVVRVKGGAGRALTLEALVAQVAGGGEVPADEALERAFEVLTAPGEALDRVVLAVDGAETLHPAALRYVQLVCHAAPRLQVVLCGRPELDAQLDSDEFASFRGRIARPVVVPPMTEAEAAAFVEHMLGLVTASVRNLITEDAVGALARRSGGNPDQIVTALARAIQACGSGERITAARIVGADEVTTTLAPPPGPATVVVTDLDAIPGSTPALEAFSSLAAVGAPHARSRRPAPRVLAFAAGTAALAAGAVLLASYPGRSPALAARSVPVMTITPVMAQAAPSAPPSAAADPAPAGAGPGASTVARDGPGAAGRDSDVRDAADTVPVHDGQADRGTPPLRSDDVAAAAVPGPAQPAPPAPARSRPAANDAVAALSPSQASENSGPGARDTSGDRAGATVLAVVPVTPPYPAPEPPPPPIGMSAEDAAGREVAVLAPPLALPPDAPSAVPMRPASEFPAPARLAARPPRPSRRVVPVSAGAPDARRCRDIVLRVQLGEDPTDADQSFLLAGCVPGR
jgi:type II secretory pathway predicted ATPase ExeA